MYPSPSEGVSRMSSCKFSVTDPSDTSSTRAATPPPANSINVSLNREICSQSTTCVQLINLGASRGHLFNAVNWATCLHRLAKLFPTEAKNYRQVIIGFLSKANEVLNSVFEGSKFQPQHLATLLWAMAKLSIVDIRFVNDLVDRAISVSDSLKAQDMANIAWSLAKMGFGADRSDMYRIICNRLSSNRMRPSADSIIKQFKPMEIASTTWAFGTVGIKGMGIGSNISVVIDALIHECLDRDLREFSPQALANVLWALSKLSYPSEQLVSMFGDHIVKLNRLREFKPQELANVVWSIQCVHLPHAVLYSEIVYSKSINWANFDMHALTTVCAGLDEVHGRIPHMQQFVRDVVAQRILTAATSNCGQFDRLERNVSGNNSTTFFQNGVFLCLLSKHLNVPVVASGASVLTERLLNEIKSPGCSIDSHGLLGLITTLVDSKSLADLLAESVLVESDYGSICAQTANLHDALVGLLSMKTVPTYPSKFKLIKSITELFCKLTNLASDITRATSLYQLATVVAVANRFEIISLDLVSAVEKYLIKIDLLTIGKNEVESSVITLLTSLSMECLRQQSSKDNNLSSKSVTVCRLLLASCVESLKIGNLDLNQVATIVDTANLIDYSQSKIDEIVIAVMTAVVTDACMLRNIEYINNPNVSTKVLYALSEFVSRHSEYYSADQLDRKIVGKSSHLTNNLQIHSQGLARALGKLANMTHGSGELHFSISAQCRLIASLHTLNLVDELLVGSSDGSYNKARWLFVTHPRMSTSEQKSSADNNHSSTSLLSQFLLAGPSGLKLLREQLDSFSLFCKTLAGCVAAGALPGSWVQSFSINGTSKRSDPFCLEAALSLSVSLGNVGAVESQKDIVSMWVLPLMDSNVEQLDSAAISTIRNNAPKISDYSDENCSIYYQPTTPTSDNGKNNMSFISSLLESPSAGGSTSSVCNSSGDNLLAADCNFGTDFSIGLAALSDILTSSSYTNYPM